VQSARHHVVIVGAGPGGCATAIALAQRGVGDILLVDKARFPRHKTCGSAISPLGLRVLDTLGVAGEVRRAGYTIDSLLLTTPRGRRLEVRGEEAAVILLRKEFDQLLVDRAKALGVQFRDAFPVTDLIGGARRVAGVRAGAEEIHADYVVCADGAHSRFSQDRRTKHTLATIMGWWEDFVFQPGTIEMIFDRTLSPVYGWMFPETASRVNIGIVVDGDRVGAAGELGNARGAFEAFLHRHFEERLRAARQVGRWSGHPISYGIWTQHAAAPGVLHVGETVRLTNAATGEGIYQAMQSGVLAADAVASVISGGVSEQQAWRRYCWMCRGTFAPGFLMGHAFRGAVRCGVLDAVASAFDRPRVRRMATWAIGSALTASSMPAGSRDRA
jgi:menaquinone-9 beta-reductase